MKKVTACFSCGDLNGVVKKCGLLKISHERYRSVKKSSTVSIYIGRSISLKFIMCSSQTHTSL